MILEILGVIFLLLGTLFVFVAGLGVLRLPDVLMRMHASTKAGALGVALTAVGMIFFYPTLSIATRAMALVLFVLLTAPVAAHMIGRAAYNASDLLGVELWERTFIDQIQEHREQKAAEETPDTSASSSEPASPS